MARVRVPGGVLTTFRLRELGRAAATLGSGVIELTSRANVQVRGLDAATEVVFAARMAAAGLLPSATHERVRNILASPMAGLDEHGLIEVAPLVRELDAALCARRNLAELPGRFLFAIDDGRADMPSLAADVTLLPLRRSTDGGAVIGALLLAGRDSGLRVGLARAVPAMLAAAEAFLSERIAQESPAWRIAELDGGPARIAARVRASGVVLESGTQAPPATPPPLAPPPPPAGPLPQAGDRVALVVLPPLGRLTTAQSLALADAAEAGDGEIRITPWRGVVVPGVPGKGSAAALSALAAAGLVTDPASPWHGVTACTGRPGCAKSLADVQDDAAHAHRDAVAIPLVPARDLLPVHWAGCERRCGRPGGRAVVVVATAHGYRVDVQGESRQCADLAATAATVAARRAPTGDGPAGAIGGTG